VTRADQAEVFGFIQVPLKISTELADQLRRPEGLIHFGTVTMRLTGDPEVLSVWFGELDAHIDGQDT
jgi:hypothetical protein